MNLPLIIVAWAEKNHAEFFDSRWRIKHRAAFDTFWADYREHIAQVNDKIPEQKDKIGLGDTAYLKSQWDRFIGYVLPQRELHNFRKSFTFSGEAPEHCNQVLTAATGRCDDVQLAVLQHWLWQVKRKIYGLPVINHLFIMLYEPVGGSGKSTLVQRMLEPLASYTLSWELSMLADTRNHLILQENYVIVFDEMAQPDKVSAESLKQQITAITNSVRPLYSNLSVQAAQNCSFIGTSNKPLDTLIVDSTSMRRFFEFECLTKMNWDMVNSLDSLALWRSIDENKAEGYLVGDILKQTRVIQATLATESVVELFLNEMDVRPAEAGETISMAKATLYAHFVSFATDRGYTTLPTIIKFGKWARLKEKNTKKAKGFLINANHTLSLVPNDVVTFATGEAV